MPDSKHYRRQNELIRGFKALLKAEAHFARVNEEYLEQDRGDIMFLLLDTVNTAKEHVDEIYKTIYKVSIMKAKKSRDKS